MSAARNLGNPHVLVFETSEWLLGHDRLATTEIYLNLSPEHVIKEFMEKW